MQFEIVVCYLIQFGGVWNLLFGKGLKKKALENTGGNGENASYQHFLLSHSVFFSYIEGNHHFSDI